MAKDQLSHLVKENEPSGQQRLREEFYVVCMLNALFGNPNIHLIQLHPDFTELNTYGEDLNTYGGATPLSRALFIDGDSHEIEKKRRNAVSEIIRFICQIDPLFKVSSQDHFYKRCLEHLLNGDLKAALALLNAEKKPKMALIVSQAFGNALST